MTEIIIGRNLPRNILVIQFHRFRGIYFIGVYLAFSDSEPIRITINLFFCQIVFMFFRENFFDNDN